jgi:hypothetical protein
LIDFEQKKGVWRLLVGTSTVKTWFATTLQKLWHNDVYINKAPKIFQDVWEHFFWPMLGTLPIHIRWFSKFAFAQLLLMQGEEMYKIHIRDPGALMYQL